MQRNVLEYLENSAENFSDKIAFADESVEMTFGELKKNSQIIGMQILEKTNNLNSPIVIFVDRKVESLVAFMGVLYSGNYYVPIDNKMPIKRIESVLEQVNPTLILYGKNDNELISNFKEAYNTLEINYSIDIKVDEFKLEERTNKILDVDPVYIIFTSGSTGVPKGIVIAHKNVIDFTDWMAKACNIKSEDIMANQAPFYFDLSVKDIYLTLKMGTTTYILSRKMLMFPILLVNYLKEKNVTSLIWATSAFNLISNSKVLESVQPTTLNKVILGGEALLAKHLNTWKRFLPNVQYINLYGPTEVTVDCTYYIIDKEFKDDEAIPIGIACENKEVMLLDEDLNLVEDGMPGEICVRGTGLAKGYFGNPEKTNEVFIQNPLNKNYPDIIYRTGDIGIKNADGNIVFQSRKDGQIKHMGYRIELGEIERAINSIDEISAAICFFDETTDRIICVYEGNIENKAIITEIQKIIPKYMYPNIIKKIEKMPYNANGKIDRVKLKENYSNETSK